MKYSLAFTLLSFLLCISVNIAHSENSSPIDLWELQVDQKTPRLQLYPLENSKVCIIVCPGGGYRGHAMGGEGYGIAKWLNDNGVSAAILTYRLPKGQHEIPLSDAKKAIQTLKSAQHKLRFTKLGIIGFSAGGHLAASSLTLLPKQDRPDFGILIYPVISFGPFGHKGSRFNLLGELFENQKWIDYYSLESRVDSQTPPVFLAHAKDDKVVVIENSQMFYDKVKLHQPTSEFLILEQGGHGLNGYKGPSWDAWQEKSLKWIFKL